MIRKMVKRKVMGMGEIMGKIMERRIKRNKEKKKGIMVRKNIKVKIR
jgi:hypothetical protein